MADQPNILFVDDEDSIRLTLPPLLQSYGFEVTSAATVAEALGLITRHKFDVLISDLNIGHPGDGFTVVSAMRSHQPNALRFILTAYPAVESALEAIREEVHDYFVKPTETEVLVEKIRSKLAQRSPDQSRIRQRLTQVIRANRESIVENWLQAVKKDSEISSIPVRILNARSMCRSYWMWPRMLQKARSSPLRTGKLTCDTERFATDKATRFHCSFGKLGNCRLHSQTASSVTLPGLR